MKKVFALMAVVAMVGFVSCKKNPTPTPTPDPDPTPTPTEEVVTATITAGDVTVDEGATAKINASTNSSATITYASADAAIATVDASGVVTGVKAGNTTITLKVDAVDKKFTAAEKTINVTVKAVDTPPATIASIEIDGKFEDWAALEKGTYSQTYGDEEATHPVLTHCKVYATAEYVYVYFEYDAESIDHEPDVEHVPFHCYINTDGDESTGGFADQFSDACTDILLEGFIYPDGAEIGSYDPGVYNWIGEPNGSGWGWCDPALYSDGGVCQGAGVEGKYEFLIDRAVFESFGYPIADEFSIGFDIQQSWDSVGILPNAAPSEENASGIMPSLKVTTQK